jgi:uncharacterized protein (DUF849 family)
VLLKACLNGQRLPGEHPRLPVTPQEIALAAAGAVAAGAGALHVHPKDAEGRDTLDPQVVAETVRAVRAAAPGVPLGLTTGAWAATGPVARLATVRRWMVRPDFVSVNWAEDGAVALADALLELGVGVEPGLWTPADASSWRRWRRRDESLRVLLEVDDESLTSIDALAAARGLVGSVGPDPGVAVLLHGAGPAAWAVLAEAVRRGLDARIGLEDVLVLPDGAPADDNAALVAAARDIMTASGGAG